MRKATLTSLLIKARRPGIRLNEHIEADGPTVFAHACKMGLEGIVSKRKNSSYRSGRSRDWLKSKNPASAAVMRRRRRIGASSVMTAKQDVARDARKRRGVFPAIGSFPVAMW